MAEEVLRRTTSLLRTALAELTSSQTTATSNSTSTHGSTPTTTAPQINVASTLANIPGTSGNSSTSSRSASENFRRLFPGMCSRNVTRKPFNSNHLDHKGKRPKLMGYQPLKVQDTWTKEICLLAKCNENVTPDRDRMTTLTLAGLGKMKVVFPNKNATHDELQNFLEQKFPRIKHGEGFDVLKAVGGGGGCRPLVNIPPSREGFTIPHLKERFGQSTIYFRPLQRDLDETPTADLEDEKFIGGPQIKCINCGSEVPIWGMKTHQVECDKNRSKDDDDVDSDDDATSNDKKTDEIQATCSTGSNYYEGMAELNTLFPDTKEAVKREVLQLCGGDTSLAASRLIDWPVDDSSGTATVEDEDDDDIQLLQSPFHLDSCSQPDPLANYRKQKENGKQLVHFNRMQISVLRQLMCIFKDPKLNLKKDPNVQFSGELGADLGGPKREFFTMAIQALSKVDAAYNFQLFGGESGHLIPLYGVDAISEGCFAVAGKLIAWSILHSGEGFIGLSPAIIEYLSTGSVQKAVAKVTTADIYDVELRTIIETKITGQDTLDNLTSEERDKIEEKIVSHGLSDVPLTVVNKDKAIKDLLSAEVIITRVLAMDSFFKGLDCMGLGKTLRCYPRIIAPLIFPSPKDIILDPEQVKARFVVKHVNDTEDEKHALEWFNEFIHEAAVMKDHVTDRPLLNSLVLFITGSTQMDVHEKFEITFQSDPQRSLLEAESCFNKVSLPIGHCSYEDFKKACCSSLELGAVGYGRF